MATVRHIPPSHKEIAVEIGNNGGGWGNRLVGLVVVIWESKSEREIKWWIVLHKRDRRGWHHANHQPNLAVITIIIVSLNFIDKIHFENS